MKCKICGNSTNNKVFKVKEMFFGIRGDEFKYMECSKCKCFQICEIANVSKYYPLEYRQDDKEIHGKFIRNFLVNHRNKYALFKKDLIGKLIYKLYPSPFFNIIGSLKLNRDSRILDIGCGSGVLLQRLKNCGFNKLIGIDPYIENNSVNGINILKKTIFEVNSKNDFDLVIFNHSFEHIKEQHETVIKLSEILSKDGSSIIRMPLKNEYVWNKYGTSWVQIDAPRHLFIHTLNSFNILLKNTDLSIENIVFDSNSFLFWGSEQIQNDIPLKSDKSYIINRKKSIFTDKQIQKFKNKSKELNKKGLGDQAIFALKKK